MQFKRLALSLLIISLISSVLSFTTYDSTPLNFAKWFSIYSLIQILIHYIIVVCVEIFVSLKLKNLEVMQMRELSKVTSVVTCPCYLKHKQTIPLILNTNNSYTCDRCSKNINTVITIDTVMKTTDVNSKRIFDTLNDKSNEIDDGNMQRP